jgi:hypothetical protein
MSRLADKIKRAARPGAAPMGFGVVAERSPSPSLLCLLHLGKEQVGKVTADAADAVIVSGLDAEKLDQAVKKIGDLPVGLSLEKAERTAVASAREAGADFVLLDDQAFAAAVLEEGVGLVLALPDGASDTDLRVLAGLPLDALRAPAMGQPLTLREMLELRRLSLFSQTPLLVDVTPEIDASGLQALREAGTIGVILDGAHADKLTELREAVLSLPPRGRRREERAEALLPSLTAASAEEEEEEPEYP